MYTTNHGHCDEEYNNIAISQAAIKHKLFLMLWCPDIAAVPNKMLYASSYEALKQSLIGIQKYIQVRIYEFLFN